MVWIFGIVLVYAAVAAATLHLLFGVNAVVPVATVIERVEGTMQAAQQRLVEFAARLRKRDNQAP